MTFDVSLAHEARCVRVAVRGEARLGRLLSLLQVLEVDSLSWSPEAVLLDLRECRAPLSPDDRSRLAAEAARALRRMKRIALLAPPGQAREAAGVRAFADETEALRWVRQGA